ncbi:methyltransferase domain-containing protein [Bacillus sp. ISL-35]|uniref:methyltransferase domain-containing protein n=1 Tax=Bacillus sp. ISL-35 TaxID=2819122 RepID=UPI001BE8D682|nr:glycosyltransferase [Bacillus sp. ISL-35]MBT2678864.1 methyltransferase domain-containing protein [Bacillus sp. ISL-35]MBT2703856.1 methyltransferase domain-containing protein [Chryseobacterium sp. ISL-80]
MFKTSIIILTHNKLEYTKQCIESIRRYSDEGTYQIIIVDNASTDGTVSWLKKQSDLTTIFNDKNLGFPTGCNQGIKVASGDDILLLNNDVVVTENWLKNLKSCLYSSDSIGAVGPVTNSAAYYTMVPVEYSSMEEMHQFAKGFNQLDAEKWEQRLKLIGFCMLIKKSVIEEVGLLDEIFSPGNFEDDDYSFRIQKAGYKLILCKDTFIHHYGGTSFKEDIEKYHQVLKMNEDKFETKWGFNSTYSTYIRNEIVELIDSSKDAAINVLEIGCACGGTLLKIKNSYKNANLYGIEFNENASAIANQFANVKAQDAEREMDYPKGFFDYIILADVLEHLYDPWAVMKNIRKYLKEDGKVLISIPNVMHFSLLQKVIKGNWTYTDAGLLDKTHIRFFTLNEIKKMLLDANYSGIEFGASTVGKTTDDEAFIQLLTKISDSSLEGQYNAYQYIVKAVKSDKKTKLINILNTLETNLIHHLDEDLELNLNELEGFSTEEVITGVCLHVEDKIGVLNYLAIRNYGKASIDEVIPYLQRALELRPDDSDTIYNLIFVLKSIGEFELAKQYFDSVQEKDPEFISLYKELLELDTKNKVEFLNNNMENCDSYLLDQATEIKNAKELPYYKAGRKNFVTLFPETENVHLTKDVGMIGYTLYKKHDFNSTIACYENGDYPYLEKEVRGLNIDFISKTGNTLEDGKLYLLNNALNIDILHLFHLETRSLVWIQTYKAINPVGKVYLKLDADSRFMNSMINEEVINILGLCDVISVETKGMYKYLNEVWPLRHYGLNKEWPLRIEYIPNGFFEDFDSLAHEEPLKIQYEEKENFICTVGRIGLVQKANEILLEAFRIASPKMPNWKLKVVGQVEEQFISYLQRFFILNPELQEKIIITGNIVEKDLLEEEYRKAKVFVLTSRFESFGLVLAEAAKNGCYIISSDIFPAWDITNNKKYGDIFEIDNIEQLARMLIENCNDIILKEKCIGIQDYAYSHFSWPGICQELLQLLDEI